MGERVPWSNADAACSRACLDAALNGPFLLDGGHSHNPAWEFQTLTGFRIQEARRLSVEWDDQQAPRGEVRDLLRACANNLLGYPHGGDAELETSWGVSSQCLHELLAKLNPAAL